ncbi:slit homolog 3 protein-like [Lytechinus variegatus]|uniref:slit homolog 3 protein-like n=1 Tax=Lytechinus variegatus TaxID=7654 RepID=UPI001BB11C61|nr:slit homolog 3 protein-like [Lytechinus variegatus]
MAFKHRTSFPSKSVLACFIFPLVFQSKLMLSSGLLTGNTGHGCHQDFELRKAHCSNKGLDSIPQNLAEDIEELDLSENNITVLENISFERYTRISTLDLSANDIRVIEPTAFWPLKNLTTLLMILNSNLVLPETGLFRWTNEMTFLDLTGSNLKSIPNDILKWNKHLGRLDLGYNHLTFINISTCGSLEYAGLYDNHFEYITRESFIFSCQTDTLDLTGNPIKLIDPVAVAALHTRSLLIGVAPESYSWTPEMLINLTMGISLSTTNELHIRDVGLEFVPKGVFSSFQQVSFNLLDISYNKLNTLYPFVFSNLTLLSKLVIENNKLTSIEPSFFDGMQELRVLRLNFNSIRTINPNNQTWTINLVELYLSTNSLMEISEFAFLGLQNLTIIDFRWNLQLAVLHMTSFTGVDNIQVIDLSDCSITRLELYTPALVSFRMNRNSRGIFPLSPLEPGESFENAKNLVWLEIQDSEIWSSNLWHSFRGVSLFGGLSNLTTLDMSNNPDIGKSDLAPGTFLQLSALQELGLSGCGISNLNPLLFSDLVSLKKLDLSGNNLMQIRSGLFAKLGQVQSIKLDGNILAHLDEKAFSNNRNLAALSLARNKLTGLNESTFKPVFSTLSVFDLSQNPLVCTCDLEWLLDWLNGTGNLTLVNKEQTICAPPSLMSLRERPVLEFNAADICQLNYAIFSSIPIVIASVIAITVFVYHKRWQLKYKLFLLKLAIVGYRERLDARDHMEYEFDVNIIFYDDDDDEGWIRENLKPTMEEQLPRFQRNVFGDADLILGMHYLDAVDYVVTRSYKTIIILSRAAVRDRWFMLKFRTAMDHVSDTQTEFVVVVFLEDIPDDELPFLVRLYLNDGRPYLHWTPDVRGQEYFWNELAKNLTINLLTNDLIPNE